MPVTYSELVMHSYHIMQDVLLTCHSLLLFIKVVMYIV